MTWYTSVVLSGYMKAAILSLLILVLFYLAYQEYKPPVKQIILVEPEQPSRHVSKFYFLEDGFIRE